MRGSRIALAAVGAILLAFAPAVAAVAVPPGPVVQAVDPDGGVCQALASGGSCTYDATDYEAGARVDVTMPAGVTTVTAIVFGGAGAVAERASDGPGAGGLAVATFDVSAGDELWLWMGQMPTNHDPGLGWSSGGEGQKVLDGSDGGAGGGSSAVSRAGASEPLVVAGGGGGAGSGAPPIGNIINFGGAGGAGGLPAQDGQQTINGVTTNGAGGPGGNQSGPDGENGRPDDNPLYNGGGGGGGGGWNGGGAGNGGVTQQVCSKTCRFFFGVGGGGGGGTSWASADTYDTFFSTGRVAPGQIILLGNPGAIQEYTCEEEASENIQTFDVPDGIGQYWAILEGGGGAQGDNRHGSEGSGAVVAGLLDVEGIPTIGYSAGCSGFHGSHGVWKGGGHGVADSDSGKDGGAGGALSGLWVGTERYNPLVIAGGGGGSGGDSDCIPNTDTCLFRGGTGGSGGGTDGTAYNYNGNNGGTGFFDHGSGGCADCNISAEGTLDQNGQDGHGTSSGGSGGGGGGGAGWPQGGHGGGTASGGAAGGGGGAGGSWWSARLGEASIGYVGERGDNGRIILIPIPEATATLTVAKTVSGAADEYARGPYAASVVCSIDGVQVLSTSVTFTTTTSGTVPRVPVGASCVVTETGTGHASTPAPPQTVTVAASGTTVTLDNVYATTTVQLTLRSLIEKQDAAAPAPASLPVNDVAVQIQCLLGSVPVNLPAPEVVDGVVQFDLTASWDAGGSVVTVPGVPVNAICGLSVGGGTIWPDASFTYGSSTTSPTVFTFTVSDVAADNDVLITDTYPTASLTVSKDAAGSGTPVDGPYPVVLACTYNGAAIDLPAELAAFEISIGAPHTVPNLPVGITCETTETDRGVAVGTHYSPAQTVLIGGSGTAQTVTNIFDASALLVDFAVTGSGAWWSNAGFAGTLTCRDDDVVVFSSPLSFGTTGGHQLFDGPGLDAGTVCSVEETGTGGATTVQYFSSADQTPSTTPVQVTLLDGGVASLTVLNTFDVAPLVVDKSVTGDGASFANTPFEVTVDECTFNGAATDVQPGQPSIAVQLPTTGGSRTIGSIVVGASCDVRETGDGGATTTTYSTLNASGAPFDGGIRVTMQPVDGTTPTTAEVSNQFDVAADTVSVAVTGAAAWAANVDYAVDVTCTFNGLPVTALGPDGVAHLGFSPDGTPIDSHGFTALETLPVGAVCSATETATGGATTVTYDPAGDGTASGDSVVGADGGTIAITNTFDAGTFTVAKALSGNAQADHTTDEFHFEVACTFNGQFLGNPPTDPTRSSSFLLTGGQTHPFGDLPVGASCLATESISDATAVQPGSSQSGVVAAAGTTVTFTNVFDVVPLTVRVEPTGPGASLYGDDKTFRPQVTCWVDDDRQRTRPLPDDGRYVLTSADDFARTIQAPANSYCVIEMDPRGTMATTLTFSPPIVTTLGDGVHELVVTADYQLAQFAVTTIAHGTDAATAQFGYTTECIWTDLGAEHVAIPTTDPADAAFTQGTGATRTITALVGAECAVTETDTQGALRVVVSGSPGLYVDGMLAAARLGPADATFENFLPGSLPVTGAELTWLLVVAGLALLVGAGFLAGRLVGIRLRQNQAL